MKCGAVIPAAGSASRLGNTDKTMLRLAGTPVLEWVLRAMVDSHSVAEIVIATSDRNRQLVIDLVAGMNTPIVMATVSGGATRKDSVEAGVRALSHECDLVLIHDAARPLVSPHLIAQAVRAGADHGAVVPGVPVTDTVKRVDRDQVRETIDRERLVAVQTPQVFRREWLLDVYARGDLPAVATDEASILEHAGYPVRVIEGEPENIKVTSPADITIAEALLETRRIRR